MRTRSEERGGAFEVEEFGLPEGGPVGNQFLAHELFRHGAVPRRKQIGWTQTNQSALLQNVLQYSHEVQS
jgi:hypothetical protein